MGEGQSKAYWQKDEEVSHCNLCRAEFTISFRRHHCRNCGRIFCANCSQRSCAIPLRDLNTPVRVCDSCYDVLVPSPSPAPATRPSAAAPPRPDPRARDPAPASAAAGETGAASVAGGAAITGPASLTSAGSATAAANVAAPPAVAAATAAAGSEDAGNLKALASPPPDDAVAGAAPAAEEEGEKEVVDQYPSPDAVEREAPPPQFTIREARFVDIDSQRPERVDPNTLVDYCLGTDNIKLQSFLPDDLFARQVLPLPPPVTSSARLLVEPLALEDEEMRMQVNARCAEFLKPYVAVSIAADQVHKNSPSSYDCA